MFEAYKNRMAMRGQNMSEMLRMQSNMVIEQTWERDPNARKVYVVRVNSGLPKVTVEHELIDVKFNINTYANVTSDEPAYLLQFRHGAENRYPEIGIGSYVYMQDEDGDWKWWLIVYLDERPSFRQYQILECNWTLGWVVNGTVYQCLTVQRYQNSYNSGSWDMNRTTTVDNITVIWAPTNPDVQTLGYNQRVMISDEGRYPPICWQCSKVDSTTPLGLTKFKFTQELFDPIHDNAELMLCNYYSSPIQPITADVEDNCKAEATITYNGTKPEIKVGGSYKIFTPVFDNENTKVKQWLISDENGDISSDTKNYTIEYDGEKLKLKIAQNYYLIKKKLIIQVVGTDNSTAEVSVEVVG
jgi:hypothetical protein